MHNRAPRVLVCLLAALAPMAAVSAQDQLVVQALKKIESVELRLASLPAGDVAAANRLLNDLKWANKRLKGAYKKDTTHWKDAAARLAAADAAIREKAQASPAGGGGNEGAGSGNGSGNGAGGGSTGKTGDVQVIGAEFEKLQQLDKDVRNGFANLKMLNKSFMGDAYRRGSAQQEIRKLKQRLAQFPAADKNVKIVAGNLQQFEELFTKWVSEYEADLAAADGLGKQLDEIQAKYASDAVPGAIYWPYERDKLQVWATRVKQVLDGLPADVAVIEQATGNSKLGKRAKNMLHWVGRSVPQKLDEHLSSVQYSCDHAVEDGLRVAKGLREIQRDDRHAIVNRVLGEGALERSMAQLQQAAEAVDMAATLDRALQKADAPDRAAQRKQIDETIVHLRELAKAALTDVRMPKATGEVDADKMAELTKIATDTLARKKYGAHPIVRLVVTSKPRRKEKTEGTIRGNVVGATITSYHYVWDEFHVVTAEQVDGELCMFHNLLKFYHSSDSVTPQDVWILSRRFQGTQILPENVDK